MRIFLIMLLVLLTLDAKSFFSNSSQTDKSKYIGALKDLIIATQKTRGLTNNFLHGNTSSMLLIYGTRKDMKKAMKTMESLELSQDPLIKKSADTITQSLLKLNRKAFKKDPPKVFETYTDLIKQSLHLAQIISTRDSQDLSPLAEELLSTMMKVILPYTEYIGQIRGMGSGIIAKGSITAEEKIKILAIVHTIEKLNAKLVKNMEVISKNNPNLKTKLQKIHAMTSTYIELTKTKLLVGGNIDLNTDTYFDAGTDIISQLIKIYNVNNQIILEDAKGWI